MNESNLWSLSATELRKAYVKRTLSPVEVLASYLGRITTLNPKVNAFHLLMEENALLSAKKSEERWLKGSPLGLLDGIPTAIKDGLFMSGIPIYRGSLANDAQSNIPTTNAPVVDRMIGSGAIILGKTTMCDYGTLLYFVLGCLIPSQQVPTH